MIIEPLDAPPLRAFVAGLVIIAAAVIAACVRIFRQTRRRLARNLED